MSLDPQSIFFLGITYLLVPILFREYLRIAYYFNLLVLASYAAIIVWVYLNSEEIGKHAAHGAPLFMFLYAVFILLLAISTLFIVVDLGLLAAKKRERDKTPV